MRTIHRTIVSALLVSSDKQLLLGKKDAAAGGVYAKAWHIPGGGIDEGEDQITALQREILEETGLDITNYPATLVDDQGRGTAEKTLKETDEKVLCEMKFNVYRLDFDKPASSLIATPNDDLVLFEWVPLDKLADYEHTPPSIALFKRLGLL